MALVKKTKVVIVAVLAIGICVFFAYIKKYSQNTNKE